MTLVLGKQELVCWRRNQDRQKMLFLKKYPRKIPNAFKFRTYSEKIKRRTVRPLRVQKEREFTRQIMISWVNSKKEKESRTIKSQHIEFSAIQRQNKTSQRKKKEPNWNQ